MTSATARAVWNLVRKPLKLRLAAIASNAHDLAPMVRTSLGRRAREALARALDAAICAGRSGRTVTANSFTESLAARWSKNYKATRDACGSSRLRDFTPETVKAIREELVSEGIALHRLWTVVKGGVPGLYTTSAPIRNVGRRVSLEDDYGTPLLALAKFDRILNVDVHYRRTRFRGPRLLLADDESPKRKTAAQRVAGEQPFDVMRIGQKTANLLDRLEAARVYLNPPAVLADVVRAEKEMLASKWPAILQHYYHVILPEALSEYPELAEPPTLPKSAPGEDRFWNEVERRLTRKARAPLAKAVWKAFLAEGNRKSERARHNSLQGRLSAMQAVYEQLEARNRSGQPVEIKTAYYKHVTRRFQAVNVWPTEASSSWETREVVGVVNGAEIREVIPQRLRWFTVRDDTPAINDPDGPRGGFDDLFGLDVSGSQPQILAVIMGLRDLERQLQKTSFKALVAASAVALRDRGKLNIPRDMLGDSRKLEENAKGAMKLLYGAAPREIARASQNDPERFGPGFSEEALKSWFDETEIVDRLAGWLDVCRALGEAAPNGVEVVDPLDGARFTWNPPKRRKVQVASGGFKLYCWPPRANSDGSLIVDPAKLTRRIAPGLIHMADSAFAAVVVRLLNDAGIRDVVAIHDAFLVPLRRFGELEAALAKAGEFWLPMLGPVYDVFERYLPATSPEGAMVREWRERWAKRVADCEAEPRRDTWPNFLTKCEGAEYRRQVLGG